MLSWTEGKRMGVATERSGSKGGRGWSFRRLLSSARRMELREAAVRMVELQGNLARETLSVLLHLRGKEEEQRKEQGVKVESVTIGDGCCRRIGQFFLRLKHLD